MNNYTWINLLIVIVGIVLLILIFINVNKLIKSRNNNLDIRLSEILDEITEEINILNDEKSKTTMKDDFWTIRYILNFVSFMKYKEVKTFISTVATTVSAATYGVIPELLIKWTIISTWVGIETNYDVIDLYNGYEVSLIKEDFGEWVSNFGLDIGDFGSGKQEDADNVIDIVNSSFNSEVSKK